MLWLYWRRSRLVILVAALVLGLLAGLALLADSLAGTDALTAPPAAMHRPGAVQPRFVVPSADDPQVRRGLLLMRNQHASALHGKGAMPAKGGNPALPDADVMAAVDYMAAAAK